MKKNVKGFTLIELLAVIVVLAVIMVIATQQINSVIKKNTADSFKSSLDVVAKQAKTFYAAEGMDPTENELRELIDYNENEYQITYGQENKKICVEATEEGKFGNVKQEDFGKIEFEKNEETGNYSSTSKDGNYSYEASSESSGPKLCLKFSDGMVVSIDEENENTESSFSDDSWETIANNINSGVYKVGDTKEVDLGTYGKHTVRVANTSTPSECSTEGFSQTACGFVIEFADIVTESVMNSQESGIKHSDGWPASQLHDLINNSIYNALPDDLKNVIKTTKVVSGHVNNDQENFVSYDKLYLFSIKEIYGIRAIMEALNPTISSDTAEDNTRQLDFYKGKTLSSQNSWEFVLKYKNGSTVPWWSRVPLVYDVLDHDGFLLAGGDKGGWGYYASSISFGVSPAFRIG